MRNGVRRVWGLLALLAVLSCAPGAHAQDAAALRDREEALRGQLAHNLFQRPLVLASNETDGALKGDVYALVEHPFASVGPALQAMDHWCDILMLHVNVKNCLASGPGAGSRLSLAMGRKVEQALADTYRIDFAYHVVASDAGYLQVRLDADTGPLGTRDYRIVFEAIPFDAKHSFVHMSYAYSYGMPARLAMQAYLATTGRDKVGFSITGYEAGGAPIYVGNVRGAVERNTMRYYLAIEAYLGAASLPTSQQAETRLREWFSATERHPRQLHEVELEAYLSMKRRELAQQQAMTRKLT